MDCDAKLKTILSKSIRDGKVLSIVDRDVSSFAYLLVLGSLKDYLEKGRYVWVVSYEPLQSLFRDFKRAEVDYERYLGRNLFVLDVFGSIKHIDPNLDGVFILSGYLDDRVFVYKYKSLIRELLFERKPEEVLVVGYLESGICRLFDNPVRTQKLLWSLREETEVRTSGLLTYVQPECPQLEEFIYMYSDYVFEGTVENGRRKLILTKGDGNDS